MKFLALLAPVAILVVLWGLERLEVWMNDLSGPLRHRVRIRATRAAGRSKDADAVANTNNQGGFPR